MKNHVNLYDDITIKNRDLLKGLRHHKDIGVAYYYMDLYMERQKMVSKLFLTFLMI